MLVLDFRKCTQMILKIVYLFCCVRLGENAYLLGFFFNLYTRVTPPYPLHTIIYLFIFSSNNIFTEYTHLFSGFIYTRKRKLQYNIYNINIVQNKTNILYRGT